MKKRVVALLLALLTLCLASCGTDPVQEEATTVSSATQVPAEEQTTVPAPEVILPPAEDDEKKLTVVADGKSEYMILYPKNDAACKAQAEQLRGWFEKAYGVTLPVAEDASVACAAEACEILIGKTNRAESEQAYARLIRKWDYACCVTGNKIVLVGFDSEVTQKAVNSFYASYLSNVKDVATPMLVPTSLDRMVEGNYSVNISTCAGIALSKFNIVYPKDAVSGELYVAQMLKVHLYQKGSMQLYVKNDAGMAGTKEIRIGAVKRSDTEKAKAGEFTVFVKSGNLYVMANDLFGYIAAEKYLTETLFGEKTPKDTLQEGFRYTGKVEEEQTQNAEYRVMFQNVCGIQDPIGERDDYIAYLTLAYSPDVVGFNEYYINYMDNAGAIKNMLTENGYAKAPAGKEKNSESVLYYKTATMTLVEDRYVSFTRIDPHTGNVINSVLGAHVGVFESKKSGERFIAVAVHFESNALDDEAGQSYYYGIGTQNRKSQIDTLMEALENVIGKYGDLPVVMGGDFNSYSVGRTISGIKFEDACEYLIGKYGWQNGKEQAVVTDEDCSTHGHPTYDKTLGCYTNGNYAPSITYDQSIDQVFQKGERIEARRFETITDDFSTLISDHSPVMLDFNIK